MDLEHQITDRGITGILREVLFHYVSLSHISGDG